MSAAQMAAKPETRKLPRRDWFLLPLISLFTMAFLFTAAEVLARVFWPEALADTCFVDDPVSGYRFRPNCESHLKAAEGPWTTNHYNECGYRTDAPCGPKPPGTDRLVLLGSSVAQGLFAPYEDTFATKTGRGLERRIGHPVQIENLGVPNSSPIYAYRRLSEALSLHPDVVIYLISPWDVEQRIDPAQLADRNNPNPRNSQSAAYAEPGLIKRIQSAITQSRTVLIAQHFLFRNPETFLKLYLEYGDKADFLRQPFSPAWRQRFGDLNTIIGDMASRLRRSGIPLVIVAVPSRAEAALLSLRTPRPAHVDPFAFGRAISTIAAESGARYLDLMTPFSRVGHAEALYYVVDGHLTMEGHALVARELTDFLTPMLTR